QQLDLELFDYVNWWNHLRLHGTIGIAYGKKFCTL
ncbi:IS3 family transposase, partial [Enterococcus faecalis]|nr:IS3 family transposase [Enterococcus faecalis]